MILRVLGIQGIAGLAVSLALALLLVIQKGETRHWKKQSAQFEQASAQARSALDGTVANYRAAAAEARASDLANLQRVTTEQRSISQRTANEYQVRLAAARLSSQRLRGEAGGPAADPGRRPAAPVSGLSAAVGGPSESAGEDRLSDADRLLATEQAIQLDELIKWVRAQAGVKPDVDGSPH